MVEFSQMSNVSFLDVSDLLHRYLLLVELSEEDRALSSTAEPLEVGNVFEWNLPVVYEQKRRKTQSE